jgi:hypothetical protein
MFDPSLILIVYFAFSNGTRAKRKGHSRWLWAFLTMLGFFAALMLGFMIVVFYFCADVIDTQRMINDKSYAATAAQIMTEEFSQHPTRYFTVLLFGIGGYLAVRYAIEKLHPRMTTQGGDTGY